MSVKRHIVILSLAYEPLVSGAERFVVETVKRLSDEYQFTIVTARFNREWPRTEERNGVRIIRVGFGLPHDWDKYLYPFLAAWTAWHLKPDLVHAVMESFAGIGLALYRLFSPTTPTLLNLQSGSIDAPRVQAKAPSFFFKWIHTSPHKIHAISQALADRARAYGARDVVVIPNGVELEPFLQVRGTSKTPGLIIAVGRLHEDKGYDVLLKAFAQALKHRRDLQLHIVGEGEARPSLEDLIEELQLKNHVTLLGQTDYAAIPRLMASAELFVAPSRAEGMGIVFVEAQASGTAVIGTRVGGIPDVIEDGVTGLLIPSEDADALARAIIHLMDDPIEQKRLADEALRQLDRYAWDKIVNQISALYNELLKQQRTILVCTGIYPPEIGGPATAIASAASHLRQQGYEVKVITYGEHQDQEEYVQRISRRGSLIQRYIRFACAVRSTLVPGMTVIATDVYSVGLPVRLALIGRNNRFFLRLGGEWRYERAVEGQKFFGSLREFWERPIMTWCERGEMWVYRWVMNRASRSAVTSLLLKEVLEKAEVTKTPIDVVPNFSMRKPTLVRTDGPPHDPLRLLYVGRFVRVKNVLFLGRLIRELAAAGQNIACTFVGDGYLLDQVQHELQTVPNIHFLGAQDSGKVEQALIDTDALLLPSLTDICPNIVIEALHHRVPVLMTREHGLPSGVKGIIELPPQDGQAWKEVIIFLQDVAAFQALQTSIQIPSLHTQDLISWIKEVTASSHKQ